MNTLVDLMDMINEPEGVHKINTVLFSVSFPQLRVLQESALESDNYDFSSAECMQSSGHHPGHCKSQVV